MKNNLRKSISNYLKESRDLHHRYNSWHHCYEAFGNSSLGDKDLCLNLGFYLASWGMYRGSSQLLKKNHLVHEEAVKIIQANSHLRCCIRKEIEYDQIEDLCNLIQALKGHYTSLSVTPTITLISKILLGTLGCLPAFDRYFIEGVKGEKKEFKSLTRKSLNELFLFLNNNENELRVIQNEQLGSSNIFYPKMKLIDMYFWTLGKSNNKL